MKENFRNFNTISHGIETKGIPMPQCIIKTKPRNQYKITVHTRNTQSAIDTLQIPMFKFRETPADRENRKQTGSMMYVRDLPMALNHANMKAIRK